MGLLRKIAGKVKDRLGGAERAQGAAPARTDAAPRPPAAPPAALAREQAVEGTLECGAQELKERLEAGEEVVVVDVRPLAEAQQGSLPGARSIPLGELEARWRELEKVDEIVCVCPDGERSGQAARSLRQKGLINATRLEGGLRRWTAIGGPLRPLTG